LSLITVPQSNSFKVYV